ncbi:MAG: DUF1232 domain-containing protein [Coriobacteriales bacterium]|nr:DUF1232 domain-containing protein [Coriobacteriales bacterium]
MSWLTRWHWELGRSGLAGWTVTAETGFKQRARRLKAETYALYLVARNPAVPWYAKAIAAAVVAYALSPIDLIPDFVPVLGYLDDLLIVPLGIWLAVRLVPADVMADSRAKAAEAVDGGLPASRTAGIVVVVTWIVLALLCAALIYKLVRR